MAGRNINLNQIQNLKAPKAPKPVRFKDIILFEDERVIVVNKPAGIASLSDRDTEINLLTMGRKYDPTVTLAHRLDKNTTGVLLFAKGPDNYREITGAFARREVIKHYIALVKGSRDFQEEVIELPIGISGKGKARIDYENGKESLTVIETAEKFRHCTLIDCQPLTGRTHQIRVHLAAIGAPLIGDKDYGGKNLYLSEIKRNYKPNRKLEESPINNGFILHARGIAIPLPGDEEESTFIAPLPGKTESTLRILRKYDS